MKNIVDNKGDGGKTSPLIQRRLQFILNELQSDDARYDQSIIFTLRSLSNYASIGRDGGSFLIKKNNKLISKKAQALRIHLCDDKIWASHTINEHPTPLKYIWDQWMEIGSEICVELIWNDLLSHPMVTVTKEEDALLREKAKTVKSVGIERYRISQIEIFE